MRELPIVIAVVGGEGTRLYPLTLQHPKPLVSMCGRAILSRTFEAVASQGFREFILAGKGVRNTLFIKEFFKEGDGFSKTMNINPRAKFRYKPKYEDKGNADAIRFCMNFYDMKKDVLVVGGDHILDMDLRDLIRFHRSKNAFVTVGLKELEETEDISPFGVADLASDGRIQRFVEKPKEGEAPTRLINTGIYVFSPKMREVLEGMIGKSMDTGRDVLPYLCANNHPVYGRICEGYWADVGNPEALLKTTQDILYGKLSRISFSGRQTTMKEAIFGIIQKDAHRWIHQSTLRNIEKLQKPPEIGDHVHIGGHCIIGEGAKINSSYIGDYCTIGEGARIKGSAVMDFTNIGRNVKLNNCIVGRYSTIGDKSIINRDLDVEVREGSHDLTPVIGEGVTIEKGSVIGPKKRVAPIYESHSILSTGRFLELGYDKDNVYFAEK
ncbi:MAG: NDP-sugar synthase [Candidatus Hydrothermarchaeaceae archaeon]